MFIRVKQGLKIRDPRTMQHIPEAGLEVDDSPFWQRRINDGDVEIVKQPPASKESE